MSESFEIFCAVPPGLEEALREEVAEAGFPAPQAVPGGVTFQGGWPDAWRANLVLRGAGRILARIGGFPAVHLAQLDKRARKFPWGDVLRADRPFRVEVTTKRSKIYHAGAAQQRIERAISETLGAPLAKDAATVVKARIDRNMVTFSLDLSGEPLHRRGHKPAVGKAPMRETLAALFLRQAGYRGDEPVIDPMCGSGTFLLEAAEIAAGLAPGRDRAFAYEELASFDPAAHAALRDALPAPRRVLPAFLGADRDQGAIRMAMQNADAAGLADAIRFTCQPVSELVRPDGPPGLVIVNPPYGGRIGNRKMLFALYGRLGEVLRTRFGGWRAAIVTSDGGLARATGLPFRPSPPPVAHGGLKVMLFQTDPLPHGRG